jgi:hypothetical protein
MKKANRLLQLLIALNVIKLDDYFTMTLWKDQMTFMQNFSTGASKKLMVLKFIPTIDGNGFVTFRRTVAGISIDITLN